MDASTLEYILMPGGNAVQTYRCRSHCMEKLVLIEKEIMQLRMHTHSKDIKIWRGEGDNFKPSFKTGQTWQMTRLISPEVY